MKFRKAILLVHGFAGGNYDYGELTTDLELYRDFDVYTFTLPGHNKSIIKDVTRKDWLKAADNHIQKLINNGYKKIYLIGHSMGGVIAAYLASKYPEIKKLVLASPAFKYLSFKEDKLDVIESLKIIPKLFKEYNPEEILSRFFKVPIPTIKEFMKLVEEQSDNVKKIKVPTLIIHGSKDEVVPLESAEYVYDNIASSSVTLVEIKSLTHDLFVNGRYEEVKKLIIDFLRKPNLNIKVKKEI